MGRYQTKEGRGSMCLCEIFLKLFLGGIEKNNVVSLALWCRACC